LDAAPADSILKHDTNGTQGPASVGGRTAWLQNATYSLLFVPIGLSARDDVFAVEADVFVPAATTFNLDGGIQVFTTTSTAGSDYSPGGLLGTLLLKPGEPTVFNWWDSSLGGTWTLVGSDPIAYSGSQWKRLRIEGVRSGKRFRALLDGTPISSWAGSTDLSGGYFALWSSTSLAGMQSNTAWSNLGILGGTASCAPPL
jgi:hypothetical protein